MHSALGDLIRSGFPIQKSQDLSSVTSSSGLIAGSHVFHRLWTPRHSPCALHGLITPTQPRKRSLSASPRHRPGATNPSEHFYLLRLCARSFNTISFFYSNFRTSPQHVPGPAYAIPSTPRDECFFLYPIVKERYPLRDQPTLGAETVDFRGSVVAPNSRATRGEV